MNKQTKCITFRAQANRSLLEAAEGANFSGATMPNGYKVPKARKGKAWIARRRSLYLQKCK